MGNLCLKPYSFCFFFSHIYMCGSTKLLNMDPIRIRIHNTDVEGVLGVIRESNPVQFHHGAAEEFHLLGFQPAYGYTRYLGCLPMFPIRISIKKGRPDPHGKMRIRTIPDCLKNKLTKNRTSATLKCTLIHYRYLKSKY